MSQTSDTLLPPPGLNYVELIRRLIFPMLIAIPFASMLFPIIVILVWFSTPQSRTQPVFWLNLISCVVGIAEAILLVVLTLGQILFTGTHDTQLYLAIIAMGTFSPIFTDTILLLRVLAFFPTQTHHWSVRLKILVFPLLISAARVAVATGTVVRSAQATQALTPSSEGELWYRSPWYASGHFLRVISNWYGEVQCLNFMALIFIPQLLFVIFPI